MTAAVTNSALIKGHRMIVSVTLIVKFKQKGKFLEEYTRLMGRIIIEKQEFEKNGFKCA